MVPASRDAGVMEDKTEICSCMCVKDGFAGYKNNVTGRSRKVSVPSLQILACVLETCCINARAIPDS